MPTPDFKCGTPRYVDWKGSWKASSEDSQISHEEWSQAWSSLRDFLATRYRVRFRPDQKRQVFVDDLFDPDERTLVIAIRDHSILTVDFLAYLQEWLQISWSSWRLAIPTDTGDANMIMVYPNAIRINPDAEKDIASFLLLMQQKMPEAQQQARWQLGLEKDDGSH